MNQSNRSDNNEQEDIKAYLESKRTTLHYNMSKLDQQIQQIKQKCPSLQQEAPVNILSECGFDKNRQKNANRDDIYLCRVGQVRHEEVKKTSDFTLQDNADNRSADKVQMNDQLEDNLGLNLSSKTQDTQKVIQVAELIEKNSDKLFGKFCEQIIELPLTH